MVTSVSGHQLTCVWLYKLMASCRDIFKVYCQEIQTFDLGIVLYCNLFIIETETFSNGLIQRVARS